ncbi:MAG TPA: cyclic nucleotide-binding domain-containing protein [Kofleriaceae bacterium]|nr:cyclic nucleotide-binding domain-containing protein [Kofleriaceae bacterium]
MASAIAALRLVPLFHGFSDAELQQISALFVPANAGANGVLFDVGDAASDLYVLADGEVVLECPGDDTFRLRPPALIGELGALTAIARSTKALVQPGATIFALNAKKLQAHFADNQELGLRFLVNLLSVVADKVHRDQVRIADMRKNLVSTQKDLKRARDIVLESVETPISAPIHETLDRLITRNRRVNYRVEPPEALAAALRLDSGLAPVVDISRTHSTIQFPATPPAEGAWVSGIMVLAGIEIPLSGTVMRVKDKRVTIVHDLMIDEYAATLEGYLTRAQLLDVLV